MSEDKKNIVHQVIDKYGSFNDYMLAQSEESARISRSNQIKKEKPLYWLVKAVLAHRREGWEDSETISEVMEKVEAYLMGIGLCPVYDKEKVCALIERHQQIR